MKKYVVFFMCWSLCALTYGIEKTQKLKPLTIGVCFPGGGELKPGHADVIQSFIESQGAICLLDKKRIQSSKSFLKYYSNTDKERARALWDLLINPDVDVIWFGRGGYGSYDTAQEVLKMIYTSPGRTKILPLIRRKILIGASDCTNLLRAFHGLAKGIYGPGSGAGKELYPFTRMHVNKEVSLSEVIKILKNPPKQVKYFIDIWHKPEKLGFLKGTVFGGNFSVLTRYGAPCLPSGLQSIFLLLEDTGLVAFSRLKEIFRALKQNVGDYKNVSAIIIGDWGTFHEKPISAYKKEMLSIIKGSLGEEKFKNIFIGHTSRIGHGAHNDLVPLGTSSKLGVINQEDKAIWTIDWVQ